MMCQEIAQNKIMNGKLSELNKDGSHFNPIKITKAIENEIG